MYIAVVDDAESDRNIISQCIERYSRQTRTLCDVSTFSSAEAFLRTVPEKAYDLVFLDIYMDGMNGMEAAMRLRLIDENCCLVFCTTSESHAVQSFRVRAFDYLLKPFTYEQFSEVMELCCRALNRRSHYIEVKEGRGSCRILLSQILYADYYKHYSQIHTAERVIRTYMPFQKLADLLLADPRFLSCYRNCLINMDEVARFAENDFILKNGECVPIAKVYLAASKQKYADYVFSMMERDQTD